MIKVGKKLRGENPSEQLKLEKKMFKLKMKRRKKTIAEKLKNERSKINRNKQTL